MAAHVVVVPLVIARSQENTDLYLYEGVQVPPLRAGEIKRLTDAELIREVVVLPTPEEVAAQEAADKAEADRLAAEQAKAEAANKKTPPKQ